MNVYPPTVWSAGFMSVVREIWVDTSELLVRVADASAVFTWDSVPTMETVAVELFVTVLPPFVGMLIVPFVVEMRTRTVSVEEYSVIRSAGMPIDFAEPESIVNEPISENDCAEYACPYRMMTVPLPPRDPFTVALRSLPPPPPAPQPAVPAVDAVVPLAGLPPPSAPPQVWAPDVRAPPVPAPPPPAPNCALQAPATQPGNMPLPPEPP